jgi:hypothetical protein
LGAAAFFGEAAFLGEATLDEVVLDEPVLDDTEVARDHSFHSTGRRIRRPVNRVCMWGAWIQYSSSGPITLIGQVLWNYVFQLPSGFLSRVEDRLSFSPVRKVQAGGRRSANELAYRSGIR